jgi:hypothetical protein
VIERTSPARDEAAAGTERTTLESVLALLVSQPELADEVARLKSERDELKTALDEKKAAVEEYKKQYLMMLEAFRKLELGLIAQKSERFRSVGAQETFEAILNALKPIVLPDEGVPGTAPVAAQHDVRVALCGARRDEAAR